MIIGLLAASNISNASGFSEVSGRFVHAITSRACPHRSHRPFTQDQDTQTDEPTEATYHTPLQKTKKTQTYESIQTETDHPTNAAQRPLPTLEDLIEEVSPENRRKVFESLRKSDCEESRLTIDKFVNTQEYLDMATFLDLNGKPIPGITLEKEFTSDGRFKICLFLTHEELKLCTDLRNIGSFSLPAQRPNGDILRFLISPIENQEFTFSVLTSKIPSTHALYPIYCEKFGLPNGKDLKMSELVHAIIEDPELLDQIVNEGLMYPKTNVLLGINKPLPTAISIALILYNLRKYECFSNIKSIEVAMATEEEQKEIEREGIEITNTDEKPTYIIDQILPGTIFSKVLLRSIRLICENDPHFIAMTKALEEHGFPRGDDLGSESAESPDEKDLVQDSGVEQT